MSETMLIISADRNFEISIVQQIESQALRSWASYNLLQSIKAHSYSLKLLITDK